jgi:hypothetical protein
MPQGYCRSGDGSRRPHVHQPNQKETSPTISNKTKLTAATAKVAADTTKLSADQAKLKADASSVPIVCA